MAISSDTIAAISTPPGKGAIAVIRLSGEEAAQIADRVFLAASGKKIADMVTGSLLFGSIMDKNNLIDQVVVSLFKAPKSYTGENSVEISCHGSPFIQQTILEMIIREGAKLASPGEFTQRAFLNGKLDLSQAEAVADIIAAETEAMHRVAMDQMKGGFKNELSLLREKLLYFASLIELELDFSEEDVEFADRTQFISLVEEIKTKITKLVTSFKYGQAIKNGVPVAIAGRTNTGKSTLLNLLLKEEKAIVSNIAGTTRDFIEDTITIKGKLFRFIDTAGIRETADAIEKIGIERALSKIGASQLILITVDPAENNEEIIHTVKFIFEYGLKSDRKALCVINKTDLHSLERVEEVLKLLVSVGFTDEAIIPISAKTGKNLLGLEEAMLRAIGEGGPGEGTVIITNVRHYEALKNALECINRVNEGIGNALPTDLLSRDIRDTLYHIGLITGEVATDEILGSIFKNFCIGK